MEGFSTANTLTKTLNCGNPFKHLHPHHHLFSNGIIRNVTMSSIIESCLDKALDQCLLYQPVAFNIVLRRLDFVIKQAEFELLLASHYPEIDVLMQNITTASESCYNCHLLHQISICDHDIRVKVVKRISVQRLVDNIKLWPEFAQTRTVEEPGESVLVVQPSSRLAKVIKERAIKTNYL